MTGRFARKALHFLVPVMQKRLCEGNTLVTDSFAWKALYFLVLVPQMIILKRPCAGNT